MTSALPHKDVKELMIELAATVSHVARDGFIDEDFVFVAYPTQAGILMRGLRQALQSARSGSHVKVMFDRVTISNPDKEALPVLQKLVRFCNARETPLPDISSRCAPLIRHIEYDGHAKTDYCFIAVDNQAGTLVSHLRKLLKEMHSESAVSQSFGKVYIREPDKAARQILDILVEDLR